MNSQRISNTVLSAIVAIGLTSMSALAATPEEKGLEIAKEIDLRDQGFGDSRTTLEMMLTNRHGEKSVRKLRLATLENPDPTVGDKSLTVFRACSETLIH